MRQRAAVACAFSASYSPLMHHAVSFDCLSACIPERRAHRNLTGPHEKSSVRNDLATDPSAPYPVFTNLRLGFSRAHATRQQARSSCFSQLPSKKGRGPLELIPRGKVGDTGDQAPAPAPITRTPCALRLKVRFTLMLRHLARKSRNPYVSSAFLLHH